MLPMMFYGVVFYGLSLVFGFWMGKVVIFIYVTDEVFHGVFHKVHDEDVCLLVLVWDVA
jgi:hypothetical protein